MNRLAIVATHHKTGTVWMGSVFRDIANRLSLPFLDADKPGIGIADCAPPCIVHAQHGALFAANRWLAEIPEARIFHLIRDPRDVVISAMHYHRTAAEAWLHQPKANGRTVQEELNAKPTDRERYRFELSLRGLIRMAKWRYGLPEQFEARYEDLIADVEGASFARALEHLGFAREEIEIGLDCWRGRHLRGGLPQGARVRRHIRSGDARQWPSVFDKPLARDFLSLAGDILIKTGYERDDAWIDALPDRNLALDELS